jgi:hypothetical protein
MVSTKPECVGDPFHSSALVKANGVGHRCKDQTDSRAELSPGFLQQRTADAEALRRGGDSQFGEVAAPSKISDTVGHAYQLTVRLIEPRGRVINPAWVAASGLVRSLVGHPRTTRRSNLHGDG